jgi:hypothetical protein
MLYWKSNYQEEDELTERLIQEVRKQGRSNATVTMIVLVLYWTQENIFEKLMVYIWNLTVQIVERYVPSSANIVLVLYWTFPIILRKNSLNHSLIWKQKQVYLYEWLSV